MLQRLVIGLTLLVSGSAAAQDCASRTHQALEELSAVFPDMDIEQRMEVNGILTRVCAEPKPGLATAEVKPDASMGPDGPEAKADADEPESSGLFGLEFERAAPDAKGHDRLRKTP